MEFNIIPLIIFMIFLITGIVVISTTLTTTTTTPETTITDKATTSSATTSNRTEFTERFLCPITTTPTTAPTTPTTTITDNMTTSPTTTSTSSGTGCPDGWTFYVGDQTCLQAFGKEGSSGFLSWPKAREFCQTLGGDLVIIRDEDKSNFVCEMFEGAGYGNPWIGVSSLHSLVYKYVDGSDLGSYQPWASGDPTGDQDDKGKCVRMSSFKPKQGIWYAWDCSDSSKSPYVCST